MDRRHRQELMAKVEQLRPERDLKYSYLPLGEQNKISRRDSYCKACGILFGWWDQECPGCGKPGVRVYEFYREHIANYVLAPTRSFGKSIAWLIRGKRALKRLQSLPIIEPLPRARAFADGMQREENLLIEELPMIECARR